MGEQRPRSAPPTAASSPSRCYANIESVNWETPAPLAVGSRLAFVAHFLGRRLANTYEVADLVPGERLVMRTEQGPFPMETTYTWQALDTTRTRMTLRNRGEQVRVQVAARTRHDLPDLAPETLVRR